MTDTFTAAVIPAIRQAQGKLAFGQTEIQTIDNALTKWGNTPNTALSATRSFVASWISSE